ncbi:MAG: SRPBCC domain-containing protein [Myxococcales bacterium]|nr:SRPBCC domain-containing protein [Myxococcales bacterium]
MSRIENVARLLDTRTLILERRFPVDPERLWDAIATREGLSHWFMATAHEIVEGGRFAFKGGWEGTISQVVRPRHLQFEADVPDGVDGGYMRVEIVPDGDGSLFRLIDRMGEPHEPNFPPDTPASQIYQPGGPGTHWSGVVGGYHGFVDDLDKHLTGTTHELDHAALSKAYVPVLDAWHAPER